MSRVLNFNPGPSALPLEVLEKAKSEFLDFNGSGMSIMETSHRSPQFQDVLNTTKANLADFMGLGNDYEIVFVGGGASLQFTMIPMNFLGQEQTAAYVNTGSWSTKAIKEAGLFGKVDTIATSKEKNFNYIPEEINISSDYAYLHITSNNTIYGTQWAKYPEVNVPLVVDMSSDILCRKCDFSKFSLIYAGAQKNLGIAGVTIVIIRKDFLAKQVERDIPTMLSYKTHVSKDSAFNTPPVYPIYLTNLVLDWIKQQGGVSAIEEMNQEKAKLLYSVLDEMPNYYQGTVQKENRSLMNATFLLANKDLEAKFIKEAKEKGLTGIKGHRSVGGIRVSMYNAMPVSGIKQLTDFMKDFAQSNP